MGDSGKNSILFGICGILLAVALAGAVGFFYFEKPGNPELSLWDSFWWAMVTVTTIGYGDIFPKTIGGRLIAMFLMFAGIGTLGVFTAAIAAYFIRGDGWQRMRLRGFKDHVIICGLGEKGLLLLKAFRTQGRDVAIIEESESNDFAGTARELGAVVLWGDAREPALMRQARLGDARHLIVLCGDDGVNAEIAAHARELSEHRTNGVLVCSAHIVNPDLWYLMREWEMAQHGSFRLQFFNVVDSSARALLDEHPPFEGMTERTPHLLIVGGGRLAQSLLVHMARAWREILFAAAPNADISSLPKLRLTLVDSDTHCVREMLHLRHPELEKICDLRSLEMKCDEPDFQRAAFLFDENGHCDVSHVYVCLPDDSLALSAALILHRHLRHTTVPIVVAMTQEAGLSALLRRVGEAQPRFQSLHAVGLLERACQPDLVLGGIPEMLARALHDKYIEDQQAAGVTREQNPLLAPWDAVPEETRESNRAQALDISEKLQAIGCDIAPLTDWDAHGFRFTPDEVELMARMEHERWMAERQALGWRCGPRDANRKTNPNLVPWEQLGDGTRDFNRAMMREIPASLARAGFQVYRMQTATPAQ